MESTRSNVMNTNPTALRIVVTNGKVTGPPAAKMLRLSLGDYDRNTFQPFDVLDNATGGGILASELLKLASAEKLTVKRLVAGDTDDKMLGYVRARNNANSESWAKVEVQHFDQQHVPLPDESLTHVYNNFGIFFCKDDSATLAETLCILQPGGIAGFTTWKTIGWWTDMAAPALAKYLPNATPLPNPSSLFPDHGWSDPDRLLGRLTDAGFEDVKVTVFNFTPDAGAEEFAEATASLVGAVTGRLWSEEKKTKFGPEIESVLLRYLKENFKDGYWDGKMVALISLGRKDEVRLR